ncbi:YbaN family protein [Ureibacillus sinduriensis]|nr:YbaN family protein [Ureibacillus sinduriensis]
MITMKKIKSAIFFILGGVFLVLGIIGTVIPLLPGGPFYLLAAFCFAKSSERIEAWFKSTTVYEKYVEAFLQKKGMTKKEKIRINLIADFFILLSVIYVDILLVKILLVLLALYKHYYFIKKIKTIKKRK